jgi:tripartite-type tricarboxylate transporter receptor subunit TctC
MELFKVMTKTDFAHISYKGTGQSIEDVLAGRVPVTFDNLTPILPYIKSGSLVPLGVSTAEPIAVLPRVPPVAQTVPGFEASSWVAIVAPANTPSAVIERLNQEANRILNNPDVRQKLIALSAEPAGGSPDVLRALLADEAIKWKAVIEAAGIKLQNQ